MRTRRAILSSLAVLFALATVGAPSVTTRSQDAPSCRLDGTWTFTAPSAAGPVAGQPGRLVVRGTTATVSFGDPASATVTMRARIADGVLQLNRPALDAAVPPLHGARGRPVPARLHG